MLQSVANIDFSLAIDLINAVCTDLTELTSQKKQLRTLYADAVNFN